MLDVWGGLIVSNKLSQKGYHAVIIDTLQFRYAHINSAHAITPKHHTILHHNAYS